MEKKGNMGPYLIVLPLSTLTNWVLEFDKWAPSVSYIAYRGKQRQAMYAKRIKAQEFNVLITTFEFILSDKSLLGKVDWKYVMRVVVFFSWCQCDHVFECGAHVVVHFVLSS